MVLSGLHILLTYQCTFECEHCFIWGSPFQNGTLTLRQILNILDQAAELGTIEWIYYEGGEPFLYYPLLARGVVEAAARGFKVGIVSNSYWALEEPDALEWLRPLAGKIQDLSVSSDLFHYSEALSRQAQNATTAAEKLGIPVGVISIAQPSTEEAGITEGQIPIGKSGVMYRGRAAVKLVQSARHYPWETFTTCPFENLRDPGRVHVDPLGNLHICQGILIGNMFETPLSELISAYNPYSHPVTAPLLDGGPAGLVHQYGLEHPDQAADACHLCYTSRLALRSRFPEYLGPDQAYGEY